MFGLKEFEELLNDYPEIKKEVEMIATGRDELVQAVIKGKRADEEAKRKAKIEELMKQQKERQLILSKFHKTIMGLPNGMEKYKKLKLLNKTNTKWDLLMNLRESRSKFTQKPNVKNSKKGSSKAGGKRNHILNQLLNSKMKLNNSINKYNLQHKDDSKNLFVKNTKFRGKLNKDLNSKSNESYLSGYESNSKSKQDSMMDESNNDQDKQSDFNSYHFSSSENQRSYEVEKYQDSGFDSEEEKEPQVMGGNKFSLDNSKKLK